MRYIEINRYLRELHSSVVEDTIQKIFDIGASVKLSNKNNLLNINDMITASIVICRCFKSVAGTYHWKVRFDTSLNPDVTIAVRMDSINKEVIDYYILPSLDFKIPDIKLKEQNPDFIDSYRFDNLNYLLELSKIIPLPEAA